MKKNSRYFIALLCTVLVAAACKKDDKPVNTPPPPANEEELITTFKITFTDPNGVNPEVTAVFRDIDGPGGNEPTAFDTIRLLPNTLYNGSIEFLNESVTPSESITEEIQEEAVDHLICFAIANVNTTIVRTDTDGTYEIGLLSNWTTGAASEGNVTITLRHQPGVKNGQCEVGDSDIELNFRTIVE
jgi:hypothetical protein